MGESSSSVCLMRSFSQPSPPTSTEQKQVNPLQRTLTTSVSFGRFESESLDWGKWSAFTHNRYLEEIQKYSKPGSVAEKKAYFEAHYKRRRDAALLEQQNAAATDFSETNAAHKVEDNSSFVSETVKTDSCGVVTERINDGQANHCDTGQNGCRDAEGKRKSGDGQPQGVEQVSELFAIKQNPVELTKDREKDEYMGDIISNQENEVCNKMSQDASTMRVSASSIEEKLEDSSSKSFIDSDKTTLNSKKDPRDSSKKRRSTSTSFHMSIKFSCDRGETRKSTSSGLPKIAKPRLIRTLLKKSKNSMLPLSSAKASVNSIFKLHSANPLPENRTVKLHGDSSSRIKLIDEKVQSPSKNYSKSSNSFGSKARSATVSSPFIFKSEERAEKRKEFFQKLEQKLKSEDSDKQQRHGKPKVKARNDLKDRLKATRSAEIPPLMKPPCDLLKKMSTVRPCSPKIQAIKVLKVQGNDSRPPWRFSMKIGSLKDVIWKNNCRPPIYSAKSFAKIMSENTSPNIQH